LYLINLVEFLQNMITHIKAIERGNFLIPKYNKSYRNTIYGDTRKNFLIGKYEYVVEGLIKEEMYLLEKIRNESRAKS
jgi:hypothetical protein